MESKGMARKAYLIITFAITLPICIAFYYFFVQQQKVILMENERELSRISVALTQRIPHNGKWAAFWGDGFAEERVDATAIAELAKYYQPLLEEFAAIYPNYRLGIYHINSGRFIAAYPSSSQDWLIFNNSPVVQEMYRKGESATAMFTYPNILGSEAIVSVAPIYHLGKIVGFTWASKLDYALTEGLITLNKGIITGFFAWLMLLFIVRTVFQKLDKSLMRFARQVTEENLPPVKFKDFPQLDPLFNTVIKLREDLKRETEHYAQESQTLKNLLKLTPLAILMIDKNGIIKACNQAFLKLYPQYETQYESENLLLNIPYKELTDSANRIYEEVPAVRAIKGEEIHNECSFYLNKYWLTNAVPLRNKEGHIIGAMAIGHDITEYEKLRKEMVRLDRLNIVGQMAASVAHEVRNPMTVARGYIQSLEKKTGDTYSAQFHTIIEELDRANHIISDFLSLARDKYVEKQKESLSKIIQEILPMVESEALVRNINCYTRIDGQVPLLLLNAEEIKQLILNLTMNALDAMENVKQGKLIISCEKNNNDEVELKVCDTGCGMDQSAADKVFEPFYTTKKNGSGLGLSVCKSIVDRHGGHIKVQSEEGQGAIFTVSFPIGGVTA